MIGGEVKPECLRHHFFSKVDSSVPMHVYSSEAVLKACQEMAYK